MAGLENEHLEAARVPRKAMPVGIFRPWTNTDAVKPGGRLIDGGNCGLKNAVLAIHCGDVEGFATVAAWATAGKSKSGVTAYAAARACKRLNSITKFPPFPLLEARGTFVLNHCFEIFSRSAGREWSSAGGNGRTYVPILAAFPPS
jgi:hypothetical protein